jgi:peptidylprolyl isomerase
VTHPVTRRSRRLAALTGALVLPLAALTACGDDSGDEGGAAAPTGAGLDTVTVEGAPGKEPTVEFDGQLDPAEVESEVVTEGDGETVASGDSVLTHIWVGNGFTEEKTFSTYDAGRPELLTVSDNLSEPLKQALEDRALGSRVAVVSSAEEAFGEQGNPQLGIGNEDSVLFVVDLVSTVPTEPSGTEQDPAAWAPELEQDGDTITGFDFSDAPEPDGELKQTTLVEGDGETVEKGQTIYVNYLGQVYGGKEPFDESYSRGEPTSFAIGVGQVVKGWDQTLVGQTVGSRVVLAIPPELGYGKEGSPQAGIKGTDTLYFVVDILAAV